MKHFFTHRQLIRAVQHGFTLIELMVAIAILAILLAVGVPSFQSFIASSRLTTANNDFVGAMTLARSEAIRRGNRVTVCKSADLNTCTTAGGWQQGWIVFVDTTRSGAAAEVNTGETIVSRYEAIQGSLTLVGDTNVASYISFAADGTARLMSGAAQAGRIRVCNSASVMEDSRRARDITVTSAGRIATSVPTSVSATCPL
ncbi:GspH/FimT family pseudopilin [Hydrogenophaga sp. RAC07]|uniref:GspH/FimT family pseudopilin n=1 Tax=Hydrogenophaga sp. RAC07 TaxID=1842537 RepID=UPI0012E9F8A1|nr:GspH/FimT family pseudopilin [Hydrogenophaga sp. RAC07]